MNLERKRKNGAERERYSDYVPEVMRGGADSQQQSYQTQRFPLLTEISIQTNRFPFDRIICLETFRIQDEFVHLFKYNLCQEKENHCHTKGETAREFDTVTLYLRALFAGSDSTCSGKNNVGHSLCCHTGREGNRKYFSRKELSYLVKRATVCP